MPDQVHAQFSTLRLILEGRLPFPAVIAVGSATAGDGTDFVAFGIADSFAAAGHRTLFLRDSNDSMSVGVRHVEDRRGPRVLGTNGLFVLDAVDERISPSTSREAVAATLRRLRSEYSYVVVDAGTMSHVNMSGVLAGLSDGTLLALRKGRSKTVADRALADAIDSLNVVGVVSTSRQSLDAFKKLDITPQTPKPRFVGIGNAVAG